MVSDLLSRSMESSQQFLFTKIHEQLLFLKIHSQKLYEVFLLVKKKKQFTQRDCEASS